MMISEQQSNIRDITVPAMGLRRGITDGMPIGLGYLAVSFGFGIAAKAAGLSILEAVMISLFNLTSAGQLAAVPIIASAGSLAELALTQLVINLRYFLMSISLSQKFDRTVRFPDRFVVAMSITDEIFAVEVAKPHTLPRRYLFSILIPPFVGWGLGTLLGALAGTLLPPFVISALALSLYAMFLAILIPAGKENARVALCVLLAAGFSCLFTYLPVLQKIGTGFTIIFCALFCGTVCALLFPLPDEADQTEDAGGGDDGELHRAERNGEGRDAAFRKEDGDA